ncbi:unnamed protein product [Callosobruchus maculatus]|uniref:Uncharacterized protein n=1 Tax=Callosobruchus maculatus TaxID=64391 RepID=A0A653BNC4_CALMS|nr:unnamed protein product [Callosobruchus maculatus]
MSAHKLFLHLTSYSYVRCFQIAYNKCPMTFFYYATVSVRKSGWCSCQTTLTCIKVSQLFSDDFLDTILHLM